MKRLGQLFLVGVILTLVIYGLNISNEAINQLTASERPPVIALQTDSSQLELHIAGEQYAMDGDKLDKAESFIKNAFDKAVNHLCRIWAIFKVVFLS